MFSHEITKIFNERSITVCQMSINNWISDFQPQNVHGIQNAATVLMKPTLGLPTSSYNQHMFLFFILIKVHIIFMYSYLTITFYIDHEQRAIKKYKL